ncbi:hypothetical protein TrVFT333_006509 [Trichoderma virens FT-333]|nr:hypothetical protein TrVFT333_006509 [Trichoderma virens FT-333]
MSGVWQVFTYIFRTVSIQQPDSFNYYAAWFVLILVAPLWTNAFVYMVFGRMVWNYTDNRSLWRIKAPHFGLIFVLLDIVSFVVQVYGAAKATAKDAPQDRVLQGLHIYMAGVGIQLLFILIFCLFALRLLYQLRRPNDKETRSAEQGPGALLLYAQFVALALIALRIVFRICEYAQGLDSPIPLHEAYQYSLDSLPMLLALVIFNIVHPGRIMRGDKYDLPSFWRRKSRSQVENAETTESSLIE